MNIVSILILAVGVGLFSSGIYLLAFNSGKQNIKEEPKVYQGPVRPTDDEAFFRETGITRLMEVEN